MSTVDFIANPQWASFIPEIEFLGRQRHLPTHEDCTALAIDAVASHLRKGGTLGAMKGYEERSGQIDMTRAIAAAFNAREHLMIEAGTGVGKSLAYLVPAILWAWQNDMPVIISTATRNLQSQLLGSDIPRAIKILGDDAVKFKTALLKGRTNYACLKAVDEYFASGFWTLPKAEQKLMPDFIKWLQTTKDGDLDSYDGLPRAYFMRAADECSTRRCPFYQRCYVYKARKRAMEAHLIIVNHALVLAESAANGLGILPAYSQLVIDEAHDLEKVATDAMSAEFSLPELNHILKRLLRHHQPAARGVVLVMDAAERLMAFLEKLLPPKVDMRRYAADRYYWKDRETLKKLQNEFEQPLIELVHYLHDYCDAANDDDKVLQINADADKLLAFANEVAFVISGDNDQFVYWIEQVKSSYVRLVAAPISVADELRKAFYELKDSVILCSATLRVGNNFKYMAKRLGFGERGRFVTAESPFDYFRQSLVLAADCLPDPAVKAADYAVELGALMQDLFAVTQGRALVLFTSYEMMKSVAAYAQVPLAENGIKLLVQGEGLSREAMTRHLKEDGSTVIFGAQSFWEGVDIAGEALSCVVLARLPFAMVGDPIVEARSEAVERMGGKSFRDYMLPEAVIQFRQGFGRLIRTKSDRGVVIITDPRIVTKNYGASFRKSIPTTVHTISEKAELLARVSEFFETN